MKTFKLTMAVLGVIALSAASNTLQAAPKSRPPQMIAIKVDRPPKDIPLSKHVEAGERAEKPKKKPAKSHKKSHKNEPKREQVGNRQQSPVSVEFREQPPIPRRPYYRGRVPVGRRPAPHYSQGMVVYPHAPMPERIEVHPPCRHCHYHADIFFSWN